MIARELVVAVGLPSGHLVDVVRDDGRASLPPDGEELREGIGPLAREQMSNGGLLP